MSQGHGTFWQRLARGSRWQWVDPRFGDALPAELDATVMGIESRDRFHAKQGRSTARVVFHGPDRPVPVYLKRHYRLPWPSRLAALFRPSGHHTPASAEFHHLERVRRLGVAVPEVVAAGERIGPWGALQSYLLVAELTGCEAINEALPALVDRLDPRDFEALKRRVIAEMATIAATLHRARVFHKDFYLCHFYLDLSRLAVDGEPAPLFLIDLHRLAEHHLLADRWRWKDLGQLLYSTEGLPGISDRDRLRFWSHYRRNLALGWPRWHLRMIVRKAARYSAHNRPS